MKTNRLLLAPLVCLVGYACSPADDGQFDQNGDKIADDLGTPLDLDGDGMVDLIDIDNDGQPDGMGLDRNGDKILDVLVIDTDCDGYFDGFDENGDGVADWLTTRTPPGGGGMGCPNATGGMPNNGGGGTSNPGSGGMPNNSGGMPNMGSGGSGIPATGGMPAASELGMGMFQGTGTTTGRYAESDVFRDGIGYMFIANGWGPQWGSHEISWNGTSFTVHSLTGSQDPEYRPAGYPTMFCGLYSEKDSPGDCGLPAPINSLNSVRTGWRWKPNGNGEYNAAWDVWLSNDGNSLSAYLMVWLRDPPGQQPAGATKLGNTPVEGLPGKWNIWTGRVNERPIVNYVQPEGSDITELEFDVLDVYNDAISRGYDLPGSHILSVAIGFEVWNGPVSDLVTEDFYVHVD